MKIIKKNWLIAAAVSASLAGLSGCHDNDNDDHNNGGNNDPAIFNKQAKLLIANDEGDNSGNVSQYQFDSESGLGSAQKVVNAGLAEGIDKDAAGHLYQAGNLASGAGAVRAMCYPASRTSPVAVSADRDRLITSSLSSPKGIAVAQKAGYVIVTESGADTNAVSVFGSSAGNATTPIFTISRAIVGDTGAWDAVYDEANDRLFVALTNGDVAYFASYIARSKADSNIVPTNIFRPNNALATASNMHGIVYDASADRLIVSDVADPTSADDGSIYVFNAATTLSGAVAPDRTIRGANTHLGNPVDLQLQDGDLYVAEKANAGGRIMVFGDIANGASGDIAPDADYAVAKPESIITKPIGQVLGDDPNDISNAAASRLHVTSNAGGAGTEIFAIDADLSGLGNTFMPVQAAQFVESISLDQNGDAIVSFDSALGGGLSFIGRLGTRDSATAYSGQRDRQITGSNVTLSSPKGIEVVGSHGVVLVSDLNAAAPGAIKAYSLCGTGDVAPVFETVLPGTARPWDVDYDPDADRLYVAATNGTILVYDNYMANPGNAPARTIDPDDQSGFTDSNIHGIVYDSATDRLIVSDVGSAAVPTDGRIYVIDNASKADGLTALRLELSGPATNLGNPVDLAFDGTNLYVAEKSNGEVQRIDNIYSLSGALDRAPDETIGFSGPESIAIVTE